MAFSRQLGVIGILGACFFVAVGCGDDEDKKGSSGDAGEAGDDGGGKAGTGGKATGGSNSTSGKGGTATGGTAANDAGAAGTDAGGTSGGSDGGGMAGEGGSVVMSGGAGGDAGGGGEGGAPREELRSCTYECAVTSDCAVALSQTPKVCDQTSHRCVDSLEICETNDNCVPWMSLWYTPCLSQADCDEFSACVAWEGKGYCASLDEGFCTSPPWGEPTTLPEFGKADPQPVAVCFGSGARCNEGKCIVSCAHPILGSCTDKGDSCNEQTGLCECETGTKCKSEACGEDSHCVECVTDMHCAGNTNGNTTCVDGKCGCGSADTCPTEAESATPVCE